MNLAEYGQYDAVGLAGLIRSGDISAGEARRSAAQAIEAVNGALNAVVELFGDRVAQGDPLANLDGPLGGVPFMLKDAGATEAGRLSERGSRLMKGMVAKDTSNFTMLCKAAGLVNLGRTTTPEAALAGTTESVATGMTRNPWDLSLSTGGSSGGAAALVAAGALPLAHGNDGAGSIRMPAALCGLVGLKPSRGRISAGPGADEMCHGLVSEFFLTRSVRDAAAALDAVGISLSGDPFVIAAPARSWASEIGAPVGRIRVAFATTNWRTGAPVRPEIAVVVREIALTLEGAGLEVREAEPDFNRKSAYEFNAFCFNSMVLGMAHFADNKGIALTGEVLEPVTLSALRKMRAMTPDAFAWQLSRANAIRRDMGRFFETTDLLITPTVPENRIELGTLCCSSFDDVDDFRRANEERQFAFTCPFNVTGQPAISLPLGRTPDGLPVGVQLVARTGDEGLLLRAASFLEQLRPWAAHRPPVHVSHHAT